MIYKVYYNISQPNNTHRSVEARGFSEYPTYERVVAAINSPEGRQRRQEFVSSLRPGYLLDFVAVREEVAR